MTSQLEILAHLEDQARMNLRDWLEHVGALKRGVRIGWASVAWRVVEECENQLALMCEETNDFIDMGTASSLPAQGWRVLK